MDIAVYIKELLVLHGELSVPGLGYFVTVRVNGYYNEDEGRFYPPTNEVKFDPQTLDNDDTLAEYITKKKNISLASSTYFVEKYVAGIQEQTNSGHIVPLPGLGQLQLVNGLLTFSATDNSIESDDLFDYPPVTLHKPDEQPTNAVAGLEPDAEQAQVQEHLEHPASIEQENYSQPNAVTEAEQAKPVIVDEPGEPVVVTEETNDTRLNTESTTPEPVVVKTENVSHGDFPEVLNLNDDVTEVDDDEERRSVNIWIVLLIIVAVAAIALVAIYKFQPALFNKLTKWRHTENVAPLPKPVLNRDSIQQEQAPKDSVVKTDTANKAIAKADTPKVTAPTPAAAPANPKPAVADSIAKGSYLILGGAFGKNSEAVTALRNYKSLGITAQVLAPKRKGNKFKVVLGAYPTQAQAAAAQQKLVSTGKIKKGKTIIQQYK